MDPREYARFKVRAEVYKALAHPVRLFIVHKLEKGERSVGELAEIVGMDVSTVSRHLSVLKNAGVIEGEKRGPQVFYRLRVPCILNLCSCIESAVESSARERLNLVS